jgi:cell division protein FtsB
MGKEATHHNMKKRWLEIITNKYLIVLLVSGTWMLFFDRYNLVSQLKMRHHVQQLKQDAAHFRARVESLDYEKERLFSDGEELERFAREQYQMKRRNEDVFVIVKE